jgi:hemoglobin/transferrin/lactoferrin receptor protein
MERQESRRSSTCAPVLVATLIFSAQAFGAEEPAAPAAPPEAAKLPEVVVTATRTSEDPGRLPYATAEVEEQEIREHRAAKSIQQAIAEVPAVSVQQTATGQESPYIRGFTGFRTLLLVDGIRVNNATFREGPNQYWGLVDPLWIERIEVVKGPSSVLYGSDAVGGTVNALTFDDETEGIHPGAYYRFGSADLSQTGRADVRGYRLEKLTYTGGVTWRSFEDLRGGRDTGVQNYTDYDTFSGDAKATWWASKRLRITTAFQSMDQFDVPRTHSTIYGVSFHGTQVGTDLRRDLDEVRRMAYARAEALPDVAWLEKVTLTLSYQILTEEERRIRSSGAKTLQGFDDNTVGASLVATSPSPVGKWTYGAEWYGDWIEDSVAKEYGADGALRSTRRGPVADDARYDSVGVFVQDELKPVEKLTLIVGGRYDWAHAEASGEDIDTNLTDATLFDDLSESYDSAVGSARTLYAVTDHLSPFAGVSQGFRAPNLSDLTRFDTARSREQEIPAPDLDPEYFIAYEGGLKGRWAKWGGSVSYFYTDIKDMIERVPTGDTTSSGDLIVTKGNVGDGHIQGVELGLDWNFYRGLTAFGTFSVMEGEVEAFDVGLRKVEAPPSRMQPTQWLLGLRWESDDRKYWAEGTSRIVLREDRLSPEDRLDTQRIPPDGTPGYVIFGVRGGIRIFDEARLFAGVENIGDVDYRVHGSGVNGPGTSFVAGLEARL